MPIRVVHVPIEKFKERELKKIRKYEQRYEMSSEKMSRGLSDGFVRETAEILEWMQAYHGLRYLEEQTPTTGTPSTTTEPSTSSV